MTERTWLEPAEWYATLPAFLASAGALITDPAGAVLLVKPNYRDYWLIRGGALDADEPPHVGCAREVREELGLDLPIGRLLCIGWRPPTPERRAWYAFIFDGGELADPDRITLQAEELDAYEFVPVDRLGERLPAHIAGRAEAAARMRTTGGTAYLPEA